jgi:hypothetical protein
MKFSENEIVKCNSSRQVSSDVPFSHIEFDFGTPKTAHFVKEMTPLLSAVFLLASATTLSASSEVEAIVEKGIESDLSSSDSTLVRKVEEFNTVETFLGGYLHRYSYPIASSGCVGLVAIKSVKLNYCKKLSYMYYEKTVATSTTITTTTHASDDCSTTATSTVKKSYTANVCSSQILYSISEKVTSELTAPRVTKRSDCYNRYRYEHFFCELTLLPWHFSYHSEYDCSGSANAGDTYLLDTCAEGIKYTYSGMDICQFISMIACHDLWIRIMDCGVI